MDRESESDDGAEPWRLRVHVRIPAAAKTVAKAAGAAASLPGADSLEHGPHTNFTLKAIEQDIEFLTVEVGMGLVLLGLVLAVLMRIYFIVRSAPTTDAVRGGPSANAYASRVLKSGKHKGPSYAKVAAEHPDYVEWLSNRYDGVGPELQMFADWASGERRNR